MKNTILLLYLSLCSISLFAQINLNIKNKNVNFFRDLEVKTKSELIKGESDYVSRNDIGQPLIYKRKQVALPDLKVYYFPFKSDSTIAYILYEWQENYTRGQAMTKPTAFIEKYTELLNLVTATYGKSQSEGDLADTSQIAKGGLTRSDNWGNDTTNIQMYITVSDKHVVQTNMEIKPTRVIRLYVNQLAKNKPSQSLSKEKIGELDHTAKLFIAAITAGKFGDSRQYIASYVNPQVRDEQLDNLKRMIKENNWELNMSGIQLTTTGKSYAYLSYSRKDDTNKPSLEILNILFDETDKIISAQPLNRRDGQ